MPQYLISVWHDDEYEVDFSGDDIQRRHQQVMAFNAEAEAAGVWVFAGGLMPASTASVVRAGDEASVTPGPCASTTQQMGGFWIFDVPDADAALDWARRAAAACEETLELRPFQG
jgi:hypothetical protein